MRLPATLTVRSTATIAPHLVRVVLGGEQFANLAPNESTDRYVKLRFTDPADGLPLTRTYTLRTVDPVAQEVTIDFVTHGDEGIAGPWALAAKPGDQLTMAGPGGAFAPDPAADFYLFVGDDTAIPAIAAAIDALPTAAVGAAILEVDSAADEIELSQPAGISVTWVHRGGAPAGATHPLTAAVAGLTWPDGRVQVFAHGEREAMKELRPVFAECGVPRADLSLSGYWAYGRTEDRFQSEKREPIGQIFAD